LNTQVELCWMFVWNCFSWRSGFLIIFLKLTILLGMKRDMLKWAYCNFITQILWVFLDKYCCQAFFFFIIWIKRMSFSFGRGGVLKNVLLSMLVYCLTVVTYFSIVEWYTWLPLSVFSLSMEFILVNIQL